MLRRIPLSVVAIIGVVVIIALVGGLTFFASARIGSTVLDQFRSQQLQVVTSVGQQTEAYFGELRVEGIQLAQRSEIQAIASTRIDPAIEAIETSIEQDERNNVIKSVVRFSLNGVPRYAWPPDYNNRIGSDTAFPYSVPEELVAMTSVQTAENPTEFNASLYRVQHNDLETLSSYLLILPVDAATGNTE